MPNPKSLDPAFSVSPQIAVSDLKALAAQGFKSVINNRPDGEEPGQPRSAELEAAAAEQGLHYVYLPVVSGSITEANVRDFRQSLSTLPKPVLAFCRSGGRCTNLWQLSRMAG